MRIFILILFWAAEIVENLIWGVPGGDLIYVGGIDLLAFGEI
jgi:hypothetical protein